MFDHQNRVALIGKRLQNQAKLATDIASCLQTHLQCQVRIESCPPASAYQQKFSLYTTSRILLTSQGIAVLIEARQIAPVCVEAPRRDACIGGCFAEDDGQFQEFLTLLGKASPGSSNIHVLSSSKSSSPDNTTLAMSPAASSEESDADVVGNVRLCASSSPISEDTSDSAAMTIGGDSPVASPANLAKMEAAIKRMIVEIGEDPESHVSSEGES